MKISLRLYEIIEKDTGGDKASKIVDVFLITLILLNVFAIILESFQGLQQSYRFFFKSFEIFSVTIFTLEYFLRLFTAKYKYDNSIVPIAILKYIFSWIAIFDLCAILPFYLPMFIKVDLRFFRMLRVTRILRILKIQRYNNSLMLIGEVIRKKKSDLIVTLFVTFLLLLFSSSIMFYLENTSQPEAFPNIVASFWWAIATLTTVGYGDIYPVTVLGKILSGVIALLGIGIVALPTGIVSSGFIEMMEDAKTKEEEQTYEKEKKFCPYCGERIDH